jgi:hypothetical protein
VDTETLEQTRSEPLPDLPPPAPSLFGGAEEVVWCHDWHTGLRAVVAVDDTSRGPGLGGVRYAPYPTEAAAVREATRLARIMTLKNACCDLPYGGAKTVMLEGGETAPRREVMRALGRFLDRLGDCYVPSVDLGTSMEDLREMAEVAPGSRWTTTTRRRTRPPAWRPPSPPRSPFSTATCPGHRSSCSARATWARRWRACWREPAPR